MKDSRKLLLRLMAFSTAFVLTGMYACSSSNNVHEGHEDHDHAAHNHSAEEAGHEEDHDEDATKSEKEHSEDEIELTPEAAARLGVETARATQCATHRIVPAWGALEAVPGEGRRMLSAKSSGIVHLSSGIVAGATLKAGERVASISAQGMAGGDANAVAAQELAAAKKELARLEPLYRDRIVSEREYQAAVANVNRLRAAFSGTASGSSVVAPAKTTVTRVLVTDGQWVEAGTPLVETASDSRLMLRVDVPMSQRNVVDQIQDANFTTVHTPDVTHSVSALKGKRISGVESSRAATAGYMPVYFSLTNDGTLTPGAYADVWLVLKEDAANDAKTLTVPVGAIVEQDGEHYAYVKIDEHGYEKRRVTLGVNDGRNYEIVSGIKPTDEIVVKGARVVKMAESSGKAPEGHSHSH